MIEKYRGHKQMHPSFPKMNSGSSQAGAVVNSTPAGEANSYRDYGPTSAQLDQLDQATS